jgi:hypothetical protein
VRPPVLLATAAVLAALVAAVFLTFADTYSGQECQVSSQAALECREFSRTLAERNGNWVLALFVIPIALTAAGVYTVHQDLPRRLAWLLAWLLLAGCIIAIFSFGAFFLPAALLLLAAAAVSGRREPVT